MNMRMKRFITILILIATLFQVMLPTSYAITRDEFEKTRKEDDGEVTYEYDGKTYKQFRAHKSGWYTAGSYSPINIFYFNVSGDMEKPTLDTYSVGSTFTVMGKHDNYIAYLDKTKVYFVEKSKDPKFYEPDKTILEELEAMIADLIFSVASGLHFLVGKALGEIVTIDDIVFNNYEEINISYFKSSASGKSKLIYGDGDIKGLNGVISEWYSFFMKFTLMGYMIMLVYMGIKILMTSTAEKKADIKILFIDWIIGLVILLLFPYAMKYMIKMNEGIVETIEANKGYTPVSATLASENVDLDKKDPLVVDEEIQWETGNDYMSIIAEVAEQSQKIAISFAFLIMTWQLITLIFHYYKRLFMVGFLIVIFPLVAFSYAIDKIADGKSQAFNTWLKEYMLNVFVQSFHAVVYVFVCSTVYSAAGMGGSINYDYILLIVGVTFLFTGEQIIREIFGQVSSADTMGSLANTAKSIAKIAVVKNIATGVASYTVGQKSVAQKVIKGGKNIRLANARLAAFDKTATTAEDYNKGARLEHYDKGPGENATDEQKEIFNKNREKYFNAAAIFNNPNSHSYEEKAKALETLKELANMNPGKDDVALRKLKDGVFKDLNATQGQILAMSALDRDVQHMMNAGLNRIDIEREVTARIGVIFSNDTKEQITERVNTYFTGMYLQGVNNTVTMNSVNQEIREMLEEIHEIQNDIVFADSKNALTDEEREEIIREVEEEAEEIFSQYADTAGGTDGVSKEYARNIAILMERGSGVYTQTDILTAASYLRDHSHDNEAITQMLEEDFGMDIDMFMHALARKVTDETEGRERGYTYYQQARNIANDYETNARAGYFDDEISVHQILQVTHNTDEIDRIMEQNE